MSQSVVRPAQADAPAWQALSLAQRAVWFDAMLQTDPLAYQLGSLATIEGPLDLGVARQALRLMAGRHDALRLRVDTAEPRQRFAAKAELPVRVVDLSGAADPVAALEDHVARTRQAGFAFGDEPLFRVDFITIGPARSSVLFLFHHLLGDGVAIHLVQQYWLQAYNALIGADDEDGAVKLPAPRSTYQPVIDDDAAYFASARHGEDLAFWRKRFAVLPALVFEDRPRLGTAGGQTRPAAIRLDAPAFARFCAVAASAQATPHRALTALFGITLRRRYDCSDIAIGMALHRRDHRTATLIGMLAGIMPVRSTEMPGQTLAAAVERFSVELDLDLRHQRTPIDDINRALGLAALGRRSLFDAVVTIMPPLPDTVASLGGWPIATAPLPAPENASIALHARELPDQAGMTIEIGFDPAVISAAEAGRVRDQLAGDIEAFCTTPASQIDSLERSTVAERADIAGWSAGPVRALPAGTLADLFEAEVRRDPDAPAIVAGGKTLSYGELNAAADKLALGLPRSAVIGVAIPRSAESVVALVAILKAGAVYLPLDPVYPAPRLAGMIEDAGAALVLVLSASAIPLPAGVQTLAIDVASLEPARAPGRAELTSDAPAYIVFTSGSSGRPKGVQVAHRALINLSAARDAHDPIGPGDRVLAAISIGFDVSIGQLLLPLLRGATIVIADDIRGISPTAFWDFIATTGVTHVNSVPSFFESMVDGAPPGARLIRLMLGGEPLSGALAERLTRRLGGTPVVNMYGPTEACIDATAYPVLDFGLGGESVLPIGRPLPNYVIHVLDDAFQPVPVGAAGELWIGGAGLAMGYVGAPAMTEARFVETRYGRLYRTGDRAAWRDDGMLAFLGRLDAQVKIRGFRVEPAEIEAALLSHPNVTQAAVIARPGPSGVLRLLAYVVAGAAVATSDLRSHVERIVPSHMVPQAFVTVVSLPLTPNGKLDAAALPDPAGPAVTGSAAPRTPTETRLAALFGAVLGTADISVQASFFELGGHSLLATQLASRIRDSLGIELPIRLLFEAPRIVDLAPRIDLLLQDAPALSAPSLASVERPAELPLSFAQERLWFLDQLDPGSAAYNIPVLLRLEGALDPARLQTAFDKLVLRHESLRTVFAAAQGMPRQIIHPPATVTIDESPCSTEQDAMAVAMLDAARPFDLGTGPLLRVRRLPFGPERALLLVTLHHIVADGWSAGVLIRDLAALYRDLPLPALDIQFADYALWQRRLEADAADRTAFWSAALAGAPEALTLPADFARPARQDGAGAFHAMRLPPATATALARLTETESATAFMVLMAAWSALLARWSGQDDIVVGTPIANRTHAKTEPLIGFFVNTLAFRTRLADASSLRDLVRQTRGYALDAYLHQDLPFEKLVDLVKPARDPSRHPIFQAMFVLQNMPTAGLGTAGLSITPVEMPETAAKFDLTLTLTETADGFAGGITYATSLFAAPTIGRLSEQFGRLLDSALLDPDRPLSAIALIGEAERHRLLSEWSGIAGPTPADTIPALFDAQRARTPDADALVFGMRRLSYADLDASANRLAHRLIEHGVGPEQPVGVCLQRSELLVVAALAVMKAGGIYVPLDPAHPIQRLADMLSDAGVQLVIADDDTAPLLPPGIVTLQASDRCGSTTCPTTKLRPENLAYIIFTSGSTGRPKGVAVSHAALINLANARLCHDPIGPGDRVLAALSVGFDVSIGQLVTPLLRGAAIVVTPELKHMTASQFWAVVRDHAVSHINSGPSYMEAVLAEAPPGVRLVRLMLGGEPFTAALARKLRAAFPDTDIVNMYGPTETCIDAICHAFTGQETGLALPIGRPMPTYVARILDSVRQPSGIGIAGELYIGGNSLARGYLNNDALTGERFVADPFGPAGSRLYRTGDCARWLSDGSIEFLGRVDTQVKIRGVRVELGEIETVLLTHRAVGAAAVLVRQHLGRPALAAYLVACAVPDAQVPAADLRRYLEARLPDVMVPRIVIWLDALPLTLNGKLDAAALSALPAGEAPPTAPTAPRGELDRGLLAAWQDHLGSVGIGIDDNFFDLGGHSLLALKVAAACEARLGRAVPVTLMFQHQTVRTLADAISGGSAALPDLLVPLRSANGPATRQLFCIHPAGGGALCYRHLAARLDPAWTVHGIRASGFFAGEALASSVEAMASSYVATILAVQQKGPFLLLGHSFGGLIAFEVAAQLERAGKVVEMLVLLDTSQPSSDPSWSEDDIVSLLRSEGLDGDAVGADVLTPIKTVVANNLTHERAYRPGRIDAPLLYVAAKREAERDDRDAFWRSLSERPFPPQWLRCGHFEMLDAASASVADVILALPASASTDD